MKIEQAIKKYGWENVRHEIIEDGIDEELVDEKERYYINLYDSVKKGYNTSLGGKNINLFNLVAKSSIFQPPLGSLYHIPEKML